LFPPVTGGRTTGGTELVPFPRVEFPEVSLPDEVEFMLETVPFDPLVLLSTIGKGKGWIVTFPSVPLLPIMGTLEFPTPMGKVELRPSTIEVRLPTVELASEVRFPMVELRLPMVELRPPTMGKVELSEGMLVPLLVLLLPPIAPVLLLVLLEGRLTVPFPVEFPGRVELVPEDEFPELPLGVDEGIVKVVLSTTLHSLPRGLVKSLWYLSAMLPLPS